MGLFPPATGDRQPLWTYVALVAFVVISLPMTLILLSPFFLGGKHDYPYIPFILFFGFGPNWSFVALYFLTVHRIKIPPIGSIQAAMWSSLIAMLIPIGLVWLLWLTADYSVRGMGVGMAFFLMGALFSFYFLLPILGVVGWFVGRWIYRSRHLAPAA